MKIKVKPLREIVLTPTAPHKPLPAEGMTVDKNSYWVRRIRDEDVELLEDDEASQA